MYQEGSCKLKRKLNYFTRSTQESIYYKLCLQHIPHLGVVPRKQRHEPVLRIRTGLGIFLLLKNICKKIYSSVFGQYVREPQR